jgi:prolyl oligopeptidase
MAETPFPAPLQYPETRRDDVVDDYHGTVVADPYRWLEDPDSPETRAWIEAQNRLTFGYLEGIPARAPLSERLTRLWNYERYGVPWKRGGRYFYTRNDGLQDQPVLYVRDDLDAEPRVLLDPNHLSEDGTIALTTLDVSHDGRLIAYGTSSGGSDWVEYRVRDVATGEDLPDVVRNGKFTGVAWTHDGAGFFYGRYPEPSGHALTAPNLDQKLYYHRLGDPQAGDVLVHERPDEPGWRFFPEVTHDGRYLVLTASEATSLNLLFCLDLGDPSAPSVTGELVPLVDEFVANHHLVGIDGDTLFVHTDRDAPRYRVVAIDIKDPLPERWRPVVPESEDVLEEAVRAGDRIVGRYLRDAHSAVRLFALDGSPAGEIPLPALGSVPMLRGEPDDPEVFLSFTSFLHPASVFRYDLDTGRGEVFAAPVVDFDPAAFVTEQVFFASRDGTRIPMFLTHRRDLERDGANPTLLYGYGGFSVSQTPAFSPGIAAWLEMGGIFALANLRGGGEYGREWHLAGTRERKQNVFDDFVAAAEFLVSAGYSAPRRIAIAGGSNGGLLVGAVMNQRPELFAVALPAVGVMDMLRFHKFTIGWNWIADDGTSDNPEEFKALYAYSPLHNIRAGVKYPATLITTADHDDRVVPAHSFKYAAALQKAADPARPALIRIDTRSGHGASNVTKQLEQTADVYAFLMHNLGVRPRASTD